MIDGILSSGLAMLLIVTACFALGRLLIDPFTKLRGRFDGDWLTLFLASVILFVVLIGWVATILAELGLFSTGLLVGMWLQIMVVVPLANFLRRRRIGDRVEACRDGGERSHSQFNLPSWPQYLLLGLWLDVAGWLFFRPHEFVLGAADESDKITGLTRLRLA